MAFEIDVLITFADKDNETAKKNEAGWVSQFKKFLDLMLFQVLGARPNILIKSEFDGITASTLDNVAVMVAVVSKDFIQSGRCLDTLESFYKTTSSSKAVRVFKVLKSPLTLQEQPPRLRDLLGYEMYQMDSDTGQMKEYLDFFSQEAEKQYWMKLVDLAYDIHESLLLLKQGETKTEVKNIFKRKSIYLAETGHDLSIQRNIIKRELQRHGYIVLPSHTLPTSYSELERSVKKDLEECSLSIHLIGSAYGEIPEGTDISIIDIQNRLASEVTAAKRQRKEDFSRLIWISTNLKSASDRQKAFIDNIKRDTEAQEGAEILQNPLEDFKNIMREELIESQERQGQEEYTGRSIYLLHDRIDTNEVKPYLELIEKSGFRVLMPAFEGELLDVRKRHIENLRNLDGAIIFRGKVNDQWVRMKVLDLLKAPGFGRKKPIQGKALLSSSTSSSLESFKSQDLTVIAGDGAKSMDSLKMFLQEFNA